jgi:hypothetical protein
MRRAAIALRSPYYCGTRAGPLLPSGRNRGTRQQRSRDRAGRTCATWSSASTACGTSPPVLTKASATAGAGSDGNIAASCTIGCGAYGGALRTGRGPGRPRCAGGSASWRVTSAGAVGPVAPVTCVGTGRPDGSSKQPCAGGAPLAPPIECHARCPRRPHLCRCRRCRRSRGCVGCHCRRRLLRQQKAAMPHAMRARRHGRAWPARVQYKSAARGRSGHACALPCERIYAMRWICAFSVRCLRRKARGHADATLCRIGVPACPPPRARTYGGQHLAPSHPCEHARNLHELQLSLSRIVAARSRRGAGARLLQLGREPVTCACEALAMAVSHLSTGYRTTIPSAHCGTRASLTPHQPLASRRSHTREVPKHAPHSRKMHECERRTYRRSPHNSRFPQNARVRAVRIPWRSSACSVVLPWSAAASATAPSASMPLSAPRTTPCALPARAHAARTTNTSRSCLPAGALGRCPRSGPPFPPNARVRAVHILRSSSVCSVVLPWSAAASATAPSASSLLPAPRTTPCTLPARAHAAQPTTTSRSRLPARALARSPGAARAFPQNARVRAVQIPPRSSVCSVVLPWSAAASATAPSAWKLFPAPRTTPCSLPALARAAPTTTHHPLAPHLRPRHLEVPGSGPPFPQNARVRAVRIP